MKRLVAMLLGFCALGLAPTAAAQQVLPEHIRGNLFAACLVTDGAGWVVGELGSILRTEDAGTTWTRQNAGIKKPFLAISCVDGETAWIGGKSGILYQTSDAGATWKPLASGTKKHIFDLEFRDRSRGLAVGDWGLLMYTDDGGQHWSKVGMPEHFDLSPMAEDIGLEADDIILYALSLPDDSHGWTVGEFGTIMATEDGGRTWRQQRSPVETTLFGVHFSGEREGWAVGIDAEILHTVDGGLTWRRLAAPHQQRAYYDVTVIGGRGWIAGDAGTLLTSHDRGLTWAEKPLPIELAASWFRALTLRPSGRGIAAGAHGLLYRLEGDAASDLRGGPSGSASRERGPS